MNASTQRPPLPKNPVDPSRIRHMPKQFAPVDRRLVYDRHCRGLTHAQMALYLFLHCVSDPAGLSYYGDERVGQNLQMSAATVREARKGLIQRQMLLYRHPMYQLLDLPSAPYVARHENQQGKHNNAERTISQRGADAEAVSISTVLRRCLTLTGPHDEHTKQQ